MNIITHCINNKIKTDNEDIILFYNDLSIHWSVHLHADIKSRHSTWIRLAEDVDLIGLACGIWYQTATVHPAILLSAQHLLLPSGHCLPCSVPFRSFPGNRLQLKDDFTLQGGILAFLKDVGIVITLHCQIKDKKERTTRSRVTSTSGFFSQCTFQISDALASFFFFFFFI